MEDIPARQPQYALPTTPLSEPVQAAIKARNITQMFTHQAKAIDTVLAGRNVVVSTSTASGKSLCYNIPILEALVQDRRACALYMFPTKVPTCFSPANNQTGVTASKHACTKKHTPALLHPMLSVNGMVPLHKLVSLSLLMFHGNHMYKLKSLLYLSVYDSHIQSQSIATYTQGHALSTHGAWTHCCC